MANSVLRQFIRKAIPCSLFITLCGVWMLFSFRDNNHLHQSSSNKHTDVDSRLNTQGKAVVNRLDKEPRNRSSSSQNVGQIDMVRHIAQQIKWSADKKFEIDLMERCAARNYDLTVLPKATVILCFHGSETFTRLIHTVHSIVQHSPPELLQEVLLIADNSNTESHKEPLEHYVQFVFHGLVRIHRSKEQLGLIKCRQLGATLALGETVIMLDSHMETRIGWLEALSYEIHLNPKTMASPYLDWMDEKDDGIWQYEYGCSRYKTVWYWKDMGFTFMEIPDELKHKIDPTEAIISPVSIGHWAMKKQFFFDIGGLDTGMKLWGGENIDLPIRVVMAGGRHVNVPCAHAAHCAPRGSRDYRIGHKPEVNYKRVVETLFDQQYKDAIYYYNPHWKNLDTGDLSNRLLLKSTYKYNFTHYMDTCDMEHLAPNINTLAWDGIKNKGVAMSSVQACMYIDFGTWLIKLTECQNFDRHTAGLFLTNEGELHNSNHIIMSNLVDDSLSIGNYVGVIGTSRVDRWMHKRDGTIQWYPHPDRKDKQALDPTPKCITALQQPAGARHPFKVTLRPCEVTDPFQQWTFGTYTADYEHLEKNLSPLNHKRTKETVIFYNSYIKYLKEL